MCGIAGILRFDGIPVADQDIDAVLLRLVHRGKDCWGIAMGSAQPGRPTPVSRQAEIALGHRRLSIIDLSSEAAQPMSYGEGRLWVTFNGEIYNHVELRAELTGLGYSFRTRSDTEVILAAYAQWGEECVMRFNGMFAFALWDEKNGRLFCARDPMGIKPFYYFLSPTIFAFASESRALKPYHHNELDPDALAAYLLTMYVPGSWSIFRGIAKLLPGHTLQIDQTGKTVLRRYWQIGPRVEKADTAASRHELESRMKAAVRRQLRSDVPVGALLSGGVDSGMVVALAAEEGATLHTYSIGFEGQAIDELPAAAAIARRYRTIHHEALVTGEGALDHLDRSICCLTEPIADPAIVPSYLLAGMAAADGVKVLLSGTGGDEAFAGYDRYVGVGFQRRLFSRTPEFLRKAAGLLLPSWSKLGARLRNTFLDMLFTTGGSFVLCAAALGGRAQRSAFLDRLTAAMPISGLSGLPLLYRQMALDLNVYLPDEILLLFDQMSMAHTLEGRVPLVDVDVVESAFQFPSSSHVSEGRTKILFRQLAAAHLGVDHVWRTKQGFAGPVSWWVAKNQSVFRDVTRLARDIPGLDGVDAAVMGLWDGNGEALPTMKNAHALFILYCIRRWYESLD